MLGLAQVKGRQVMIKSIVLCCLCFFATLPLRAQDWSFAVGPGFTSFLGDASQQKLSTPGFAINAEAWYYLNDNFQIKSGLSFYRVRATDNDTLRLRSFDASNFELYSTILYYFPEGFVKPFAYAGIGFTTNNPMGPSRLGEWDLREVQPEGTDVPGLVGMIPLGFGVEYEVTPVLSVVADVALRYALSDQMDAISKEIIRVDQLSPRAVEYYESLSEGMGRRVREEATIRGGRSAEGDIYGMFSIKVKFTPTSSIFGCIDPYKYSRPDRKRKRRNFDPI
jgi:hypothetical protein